MALEKKPQLINRSFNMYNVKVTPAIRGRTPLGLVTAMLPRLNINIAIAWGAFLLDCDVRLHRGFYG